MFYICGVTKYIFMDQDNTKSNYLHQIGDDYKNLMNGFNNSTLFNAGPILSNGKYIQLSAYEEKKVGAAVTAGDSSIIITK